MNYSIIINTTDSFEDCWIPFFTLFKKYWPNFNGKLFLNTESKTFTFPGIKINCIQNSKTQPHRRITWSECLMYALEQIDTDIVLYMQEDYFIKDFVKNEIIDQYVQLMTENTDIHCIHLTDQSVLSENEPSCYSNLYLVTKKQRYRISCQAALWRKDILHSYLRPHENAWQFEEFGSKRSSRLFHNFYVVDKNWIALNNYEIIPYIFTGIIQGKWFKEVKPLFINNNIHVDYSKRGFFDKAYINPLHTRIQQKLKRIPIFVRHYKEMLSVNIKNIGQGF